MVIFLPYTLTVSVGSTLVPGSMTSLPLTETLPCLMSSAASRREQTPEWAMYLFSGSCSWLPGAVFGAGVLVLWHGYNYPIEKKMLYNNMPLKLYYMGAACIAFSMSMPLFRRIHWRTLMPPPWRDIRWPYWWAPR